ncbi:MAG: HAMP domain-containing sensor histidine kinase [Gammaproteobacteria bacterium]
MMSNSIAQRTFRLFFFVNIGFLGIILAFSWWALEDLELTMLESDRQVELQYFAENGERDKPQHISTGLLISAFIPSGFDPSNYLPVLFENIPVPFQGEVEFLGKDYSVVTQAFAEGNYYLAKDLALFEAREKTLIFYVAGLALVICLCSYLLARLFSIRIAAPVLQLAGAIGSIDEQNNAARLTEDFVDAELNAVAAAINGYRSRLDASVAREKRLISMASHELRTPVAVVLGAARIIQSRGQLAADDAKTLQRIVVASEEMSANIHALLSVVRQEITELAPEPVVISDVLEGLCADYRLEQPANAPRLLLERQPTQIVVNANKALVRMLLHNVISNALAHTEGNVLIQESPDGIAVCDSGSAKSKPVLVEGGSSPVSGLGLYIVRLACEQLGWQLALVDEGPRTCVNVYWGISSNGAYE